MIPRTPFLQLYETIGFEACVKQQKVARLAGGGDWELDRDRAELRIGELRFTVQFLGTESYLSETWQWADADVQVGPPPTSVADCARVRSALRGSVPGTLDPDRFAFGGNVGDPDATSLARVACSLAGASALYKCEHEDGTVYVLLHDERIDATPALDADALTAAFAVFQWYPCDHRAALDAFVRSAGMTVYESSQRELSFELPTGDLMTLAIKEYADGGRSMSFDVAR